MNRVGLGLAVGAGYVLGRTKKMKMAFAVGSLVAGKRMHLSPRALADLVSQQLQNNPQLKEIGDQLREDLRGVGKAASGAMVERQIDALADRLHGRTAQVRDQLSGATDRAKGLVDDEEDETQEDENEESAEAEGEDSRDEYDDEEPADEERDVDEPEGEEEPGSEEAEGGPARKTAKKAAKKAPAKRTAAKRSPAKKAPAKKAASKQATAKKSAAKRTAARKTASARGGSGDTRARRPKGGGER
ncbi:DNA primase [Streptomyces sp. NPDC049541]|uniref:DNA primase n=1 Tax=Streptomyces sp. NPDC049541 TaxID=3365594 RepID=UPI0037B3377D